MALADALVRETSGISEAKFYLAELALTLKRVRVSETGRGGLNKTIARKLLRETIDLVSRRAQKLSAKHGTPLGAYVRAALGEARR
jgi:hypothetical protein